MPDYRWNWVSGGMYFFTVALLERKRDFLVTEIGSLPDAVRRVKRLYPYEIVAWVVLPDHLHCIWTLPARRCGLRDQLAFNQVVVRKESAETGTSLGREKKRKERGVWHRRYIGRRDSHRTQPNSRLA